MCVLRVVDGSGYLKLYCHLLAGQEVAVLTRYLAKIRS